MKKDFKNIIDYVKKEIDKISPIVYAIVLKSDDEDDALIFTQDIKNKMDKIFGEYSYVTIIGAMTNVGMTVFVTLHSIIPMKYLWHLEKWIGHQENIKHIEYMNLHEYVKKMEDDLKGKNDETA